MELFAGHRLVNSPNGDVLILYLDFKSEFADSLNSISEEKGKTLRKAVEQYISRYLSNRKVKIAHIVVGSALLATITFSPNYQSVQASSSPATYTVQRGDTLYKIANRFYTTIDDIKKANNLNTNMIFPNQSIKIPFSYKVQPNDSLYKIAIKFYTSVSELKRINNLTSNLIYPGQILKYTDDNSSELYVVQDNDSLFKIASKYNTSVEELKKINRLTNDMIYPDQVLRTVPIVLPSNTYSLGDKDDGVKAIQTALISIGYELEVDGVYNYKIREIILNFQKRYPTLTANGIYNDETKKHLQEVLDTSFRIVANTDSTLVLVNKSNSLPYDYVPNDLVVPDVAFTFDEFLPKKQMRKEAALALEQLFNAAKQSNISLLALSGYRSFDYQSQVFARSAQKTGGVSQWSARPGESEHQTGLAMDVTSPSVNYQLSTYLGETKEGIWLKENAYKYGFIIRYLKGKEDVTGYQYEPWHIRYVGKDAAKEISKQNITLEEYLNR